MDVEDSLFMASNNIMEYIKGLKLKNTEALTESRKESWL